MSLYWGDWSLQNIENLLDLLDLLARGGWGEGVYYSGIDIIPDPTWLSCWVTPWHVKSHPTAKGHRLSKPVKSPLAPKKVTPLNALEIPGKKRPQKLANQSCPGSNLKHLFLFRRKNRCVEKLSRRCLETHKTTSAPPHQHRCTWSLTLRTLKGTLPDTNTSFVFTGEENVCFFGSYHRMSGNLRSLGPKLSVVISYLLIQRFTCAFLRGSDSLGWSSRNP